MSAKVTVLSLALLAGLTAGCASVGPDKLVSTHEGYNDAVQIAVSREVLKNIVRERYLDPPQFIQVTAINAQFSVSVGAEAGVGGIGAGAVGQAGANIGYSDSPTITFVPQFGAGDYKSFAAPIDVQEAIAIVFQWGSMQPHDIEFAIGAINDADDRAGPAGDAYRARVNALARLFSAGATVRYFREFLPAEFAPIPREKVVGRAYADAVREGFVFHETEDGDLGFAQTALTLGFIVPRPHEGQIADDLRLLGLTPGGYLYPIRPPSQAMPSQIGELQPDTLWLSTRSAWRMIEIAAMGVEVPDEHRRLGIVPAEAPINSGANIPLRVQHSTDEPTSVYRVQHRGYWFYIDETDLASRQVFVALVVLYTSRIGSAPPEGDTPALVLPIGGG